MNTYTDSQILSEFRRRRYLEPMRDDCVIERVDGVNTDLLLMDEIRQWYANLIDTAPPCMLAAEDVAHEVTVEVVPGTGAVTLTLPDDVRRVISLTIEGNPTPVVPLNNGSHPLLALQSNPFTRGGHQRPVAFIDAANRITLFAHDGMGNPPQLSGLIAVRLTPGEYKFDERAWETVPQIKL